MKSNHSTLNDARSKDPCCDELILWIKLKSKIQGSAKWILGLLALILATLFMLGYLLDPPVIRILWLVINGTILIVILPLVAFFLRGLKQCIEEFESEL